MEKIYHVDLTPRQSKSLQKMTRVGSNKAKVIRNAHILLKASEGKTDNEIAQILYIGEETVKRTRQRYWEKGLEAALKGKQWPSPEPTLSDEQEAYLIALTCSDAPEGYAAWTLDLLQERLVADGIIESISRSTVRMILKKTN